MAPIHWDIKYSGKSNAGNDPKITDAIVTAGFKCAPEICPNT